MKQFLLLILFFLLVGPFHSFAETIALSDSPIQLNHEDNNYLEGHENLEILVHIGDSLIHKTPDSSFVCFRKALIIAKQNSDLENQAILSSKLGTVKYIKGEYDKSMEYFLDGLNTWREIGNKAGIAKGLNNIALIYNVLDIKDKAVENHKESVEICLEIGDSVMLGLNYHNLGILYNDINEFELALYYANECKKINEMLQNKSELLKLHTLIGHIHLLNGDLSLAKENFLVTINDSIYGNEWDKCYALAGLAYAELKLGNPEESIQLGENSLETARKLNAKWDIQYITGILSEAYAQLGDFEKAYNNHKIYKLYNDSIFNETKETRINYLQLRQKESEYLLLEKENEIQQQRVRKRNIQILMVFIALFVVLLIAGILLRISYLKIKLNRELSSKNSEIESKNTELLKLNATKDTLFRIIGHDLKNPMGTVISFTDLVLSNYDELEKKDRLEFITTAKNSALSAIDLLNNLLLWAKSQSHSVEINITNVKVIDLIQDIGKSFQTSLAAKNISLVIDVDENYTAETDINMISVVIRNLLSNAIKFTNQSGNISISVVPSGSKMQISIVDNGLGMTKEKLENLFNAESATSSVGTNNEKGMGIGLLLCQEIVEKLGGKIWAESQIDEGSKFFILL